ncbi:hypothetical protein BpHYR1_046199 [Brachionus plicatilis]|uniref:Uncharacterized protein n=1 Tax=Brachionus plicatilis TaxID=10195 RepID=A0A3M7Q3L6_BRAPC|nr:hypothetical protein BpHYR1_046199 [Brachionus plicatilis]
MSNWLLIYLASCCIHRTYFKFQKNKLLACINSSKLCILYTFIMILRSCKLTESSILSNLADGIFRNHQKI